MTLIGVKGDEPEKMSWTSEAKSEYKAYKNKTLVGHTSMSELKRPERLQIMLTQEELKALDDWRFLKRMPSRAASIRELLKRGLAAEGILIPNDRAKSREYGVIDSPRVPKTKRV